MGMHAEQYVILTIHILSAMKKSCTIIENECGVHFSSIHPLMVAGNKTQCCLKPALQSLWQKKKVLLHFVMMQIHPPTPNCATIFLRDVFNLAWISSCFSSVSLCLLCVLLLSKTEPVVQNCFPTWNLFARKFLSEFTMTLLVATVLL
jgi:hypothetical protein